MEERWLLKKKVKLQAMLELEMHGERLLTIDISGPTRDRVVKKLQFGNMKMKMKQKN